jgi:hypothetical protein
MSGINKNMKREFVYIVTYQVGAIQRTKMRSMDVRKFSTISDELIINRFKQRLIIALPASAVLLYFDMFRMTPEKKYKEMIKCMEEYFDEVEFE